MDNNTRKLLQLTDESLILGKEWLSREVRNNRAIHMISRRLINPYNISPQCNDFH